MPYGRILTEVVSTDQTQSRFVPTFGVNILPYRPITYLLYDKREQVDSFNVTVAYTS